jgi:hypothetical protein
MCTENRRAYVGFINWLGRVREFVGGIVIMQHWLEFGERGSEMLRANRKVISVEVECDHATDYCAFYELQAVAAGDA